METKEILNENRLLLDKFVNTASKEDLQKVLDFVGFALKSRNSEDYLLVAGMEQQVDEAIESFELNIDTGIDVKGILMGFGSDSYQEFSNFEKKILSSLQKGNISKEAFDVFEQKLPIDEFIETASKKDLQAVLEYIAILKRNIGVGERQASGSEEELEEPGLYIDDKFDVQGCLYGLNDFELGKIENKILSKLEK